MFSYKWLIYSMGLSVSITPGFIIVTALGAQVPSDSSDPESLVIRAVSYTHLTLPTKA